MPMTPFQIDRQEILEIFADRSHVLRAKSGWLARTYFGFDPSTSLEHLVVPELILSKSTDTRLAGYYVPYSATAAYGAGSDTAFGVLGQLVDLTYNDEAVAPVVHAKLIEAHCYLLGETQAESLTISAGIKSALNQITWV